jgi:hypothetical protein
MYQFGKLFMSTLVVTAVSLALSLPAHATVTFTPGNHPQPDEDNILLMDMTTGSPVTGVTNMGGITVDFSSTTDSLTEPNSGQARVGSTDGAVNDLNIFVPGGDYTDLIINPFLDDSPDGSATVDVTTNMGLSTFTYDLSNGSNFLTIVASGGEKITNTEITSDSGFGDLRQPRISGAEIGTTPVVPEPCTLALLGSGMLPLIGTLRRRKA